MSVNVERVIELQRHVLFELSKQYTLSHPVIVHASQELDKLLNLYDFENMGREILKHEYID